MARQRTACRAHVEGTTPSALAQARTATSGAVLTNSIQNNSATAAERDTAHGIRHGQVGSGGGHAGDENADRSGLSKAFEEFRKTWPGQADVQTRKKLLAAKFAEAQVLAEQVSFI